MILYCVRPTKCYMSTNADAYIPTQTYGLQCMCRCTHTSTHIYAQTHWLLWAGLCLTYHLLHHIIFHSAQHQQQRIFSFTALFLLLCFFSLSCIQLAFKQGWFWQDVNPAGGISPSPTKLLRLAFECQCTFLALPDELLDVHYSKNVPLKEFSSL